MRGWQINLGYFLLGMTVSTTALCASLAQTDAKPDATSAASVASMPAIDRSRELPVRKIPNIPPAAEAYYAPDDYHLIVQTQDPAAQQPPAGRVGGALTYVVTDDGKEITRINDRGQDACSYFFPDQKRIVWTSTRDHMDMPLGDWSRQDSYPQGAELYVSDLDGKNIVRLTDNEWYEAEVSISPNGEWIVFGRQIDGNLNLWRMRADGSDEQQITFTEDWQPGAPFYLPDNETIMFRAWRRSEYGKIRPTPMTVFTIRHDGTDLKQRTFDRDMNWAPYPAPDGRHYVFVKVVDGNNWEVFLGDLAGGEPVRLSYNPGFDGLPSLSHDGTKMLFGRSETGRDNLYTYVMDVSSLDLGPEHYQGIPDTPIPENAVLVTDFNVGHQAAGTAGRHVPKVVMPGDAERVPFPGHATWLLSDAEGTPAGAAILELEVPARSFGAPPHVHSREDEQFYVLEGQVEFLDRERTVTAGAGTLAVLPRGHLHGFWNPTDRPARLLLIVTPGEFASFFDQVVATLRAEHADDPQGVGAIIARVAQDYGVTVHPEKVPASAHSLLPGE